MLAKALEIRDRNTFIATLAVDMNPADVHSDLGLFDSEQEAQAAARAAIDRHEAQRWLLRRCGYPCDGRPNILITHLAANGTPAWNDPYAWPERLAHTFPVAHHYIIEHWAELKDGDVVDVEFIMGLTKEPKRSEREAVPL